MTNQQRKENRNAGFSLIELIVTVLIMAVVSGGAVIGVSQISRTNVSSVAEKLMAEIDRVRYESLFLEGEVFLELSQEDDDFVAVTKMKKIVDGLEVSEERYRETIGDTRISITATTKSGLSVALVAPTKLVFAFYKSGGALKPDGGNIYTSLRVENASKSMEIALVEHTGRCFLDVEE